MELETNIENKMYEIKYDYMKHINSIEMEISAITLKKIPIFWTDPHWYNEVEIPKVTWKIFTCIKYFPSLNFEGITLLQIKNCGMPLDPQFFNPYQQITAGKHKNHSKIPAMIYQN